MDNYFIQPIATRMAPPVADNLLPVGAHLFPLTDGGSLLHIKTMGGETFADDISEQFTRTYSEANKLAATLGAKTKDWMDKAKVGEIVDETLKNAKDSAMSANAMIADPNKLKLTLAANGKIISASLGAAVIVVGGVWLFAAHQATVIAKDKVEGFIVHYNLSETLSYDDVSASPFGSVTITGVKARISPNTTIKVASLNISDVEIKNDNIQSINLSAKSFELPLPVLARDQHMSPMIYDAIGMGYTTLIGDLTTAVRFDDNKKTLVLETSGDIRDVGDWKFKIALGEVSLTGFGSLYNLSQMTKHGNAFAELEASGKALQYLAELTLSEAKLTVDDSAYRKRSREVTNFDIPQDDSDQETLNEMPVDETELVRAGMLPSEAKATHEAMNSWLRDGGSLHIMSNLDRPLSLFRNGSIFAPVFDTPAHYLAVTKSKISN